MSNPSATPTPPETWIDDEPPLGSCDLSLPRFREPNILIFHPIGFFSLFLVNFFWVGDVHLPCNNVREGALSFWLWGCEQRWALRALLHTLVPEFPHGGGMTDLRKGKVWGHLSPVLLRARHTDISFFFHHFFLKKLTTKIRRNTDEHFYQGFWHRCWRNSMCATLKDMA